MPRSFLRFNRIAEKQMEELCSRYGPLVQIWFDAGAKTPSEGGIWSPGMVDVPLRGANKTHDWFWAPNREHGVEPVDRLVQMYRESVGRNCHFIIGEVIQPDGLVPAHDIQRLADFGREIQRRWGSPIATTSGRGPQLELQLPKATRITSVVLMEDIAHGERIQNYTLSGRLTGGQWQEIARGQSVGHKRLEQFAAIEVTALRLAVDHVNTRPSLGHPGASSGASRPSDRCADRARGIAEKNGASSGEWTRLRFKAEPRLRQFAAYA